ALHLRSKSFGDLRSKSFGARPSAEVLWSAKALAERSAWQLLRGGCQLLALLDDVGRDDLRDRGALVGRIVHGTGRNDERLSRPDGLVRFPRDLEDHRSLQHVTDLFTRVRVTPRRRAWLKLTDCGDHFVTRRGNVGLLENGTFEPGWLRVHPRRKANDGDGQRDD